MTIRDNKIGGPVEAVRSLPVACRGFLRNCSITARPGDEPLFVQHADGTVTAHLDGYEIRPLPRSSAPGVDADPPTSAV